VECVVGLNRGQAGFGLQSAALSAAGASAADGVEEVSDVVVVIPFSHSAQVVSPRQPSCSAALVDGLVGAVENVSGWFSFRFSTDAPVPV